MEFKFKTDPISYEFCCDIIEEMEKQFGMDKEEAIAQLNEQWQGMDFNENSLIHHETATYWATVLCRR